MKAIRLSLVGMAFFIFLPGCQKEIETVQITQPEIQSLIEIEPLNNNWLCPYIVTLESVEENNGIWTWTWSILNPLPGNGNNGTAQDLSHWGMNLFDCIEPQYLVSAGYSSNGTNWTNFTPQYAVDPSQDCLTTPVLKFDFGTSGIRKSWYRVVVNRYYDVGTTCGYYKSGRRTGCGIFEFMGFRCAIR